MSVVVPVLADSGRPSNAASEHRQGDRALGVAVVLGHSTSKTRPGRFWLET